AYDRVTIGDVVDRLVAKNYVTRTVSARDRRARELSITAAARRVLEEVTPCVRELQEEILVGLSPDERKEFVRLAAKAATAANDRSRAPLMPMGQ
ncbi:MarR family winged helix-turn-helix transcriptional regulator, partial [Rhizobiaceae sp. 2RAB30]